MSKEDLNVDVKIDFQSFDKSNLPDNYIEDLNKFFIKNQFNSDHSDYNDFIFTIKNDDKIKNIHCCCKYFYYINDNMDGMVSDLESRVKIKLENDENIDDEVEMSGIINFIKEKFEDSPSYKENKKGFLFILSTEAGKFPIFIDDLGLIFRLEVENSTEVFDTENYIKK